MARKFVKATGLHNIFNAVSDTSLDLTSIKQSVQSKVNETTIVFLTASGDASYGYPNDSKYIWTMNTLYPTNSYDEIIKEDEEVLAGIISKLNYTIGLDASANLGWSEESGLTADTIKSAIENIAADEKVKVNSSTVDALFPLMAIGVADPSDGSAYNAIYDSGIVMNASLHSVAFGYENNANGKYSVAEGYQTQTNNDNEHAQGKYNVSHSNTIHSIGIGIDSSRENAVEVLNNGEVYITGIGNYEGTDTNDQDSNIKPIQEAVVQSDTVLKLWSGTQAQYDEILIKDNATLYLIKD